MARIYISGPMTGYKDLNFGAFHETADFLRDRGDDPVNPAEINPDPTAKWLDCIIEDIKQLGTCDGIYMIQGWSASRGAQIERMVAQQLGLEIEYYNDF